MSAIAAGELSKRLTIQESLWQKDAFGAPKRLWVDRATVWASVQPLSAREVVLASRISVEATHQIQIRYQRLFSNPIKAAAYRMRDGERLYRIHAMINEGEKNVSLTLYASEGLDDGQSSNNSDPRLA